MVFLKKKKMEKKKKQNNTKQHHNCGVAEALAVCSLQGPDVGVGASCRCWSPADPLLGECSTV